jgi:hypothetical protein
MNKIIRVTLICSVFGSILCVFPAIVNAQGASTTMTFSSLGFNTTTTDTATINFSSSYTECSGQLHLHFLNVSSGRYVTVKINNASVFYQYYNSGDQQVDITILTGTVVQGSNSVGVTFSSSGTSTLYEDSTITLNQAILTPALTKTTSPTSTITPTYIITPIVSSTPTTTPTQIPPSSPTPTGVYTLTPASTSMPQVAGITNGRTYIPYILGATEGAMFLLVLL